MSIPEDPRAGIEGWIEMSAWHRGREQTWLERTIDSATGHVEQFYPALSPFRRLPTRSGRLQPPTQVEVLLAPQARDSILHAAAWQSGVDGLETGGWLIGDGRGTRAFVSDATRPGPGARREIDALTLDYSDLARFRLRSIWGDPFSARIGKWHTHPGGPAEPSDVDLKSWRAGLEVINRDGWQPYYVAIIAAPASNRSWDLHTWVARHGRDGSVVVEPAELSELDVRALWE